jgi:hypothetical protein
MRPRSAFWLALGAWTVVATASFSVQAQNETPPAVAKPAIVTPQDLAFGGFIALIRGHLLTGDELAAQRDWEGASRHFGFPREEIYGVIRDDLRSYKTPPFDEALKALVRAAKARDAKQYQKARARVEDALAAANAGLKAKVPNWPHFVVAVSMSVLKTAPDEYDEAIGTGRNSGRIVHPIGYQTARGFILQADRMFEGVAGELAGDNIATLSDIRAGFAQLKQAFAGVHAPKQAALDSAAVAGIVSNIAAAAGKLTDFAN